MRTAEYPDGELLKFLHTTYQAAADLGDWDREALEDHPIDGAMSSPAAADERTPR